VGRICRKGRFQVWNERVGDGKLIIIIISMTVSGINDLEVLCNFFSVKNKLILIIFLYVKSCVNLTRGRYRCVQCPPTH